MENENPSPTRLFVNRFQKQFPDFCHRRCIGQHVLAANVSRRVRGARVVSLPETRVRGHGVRLLPRLCVAIRARGNEPWRNGAAVARWNVGAPGRTGQARAARWTAAARACWETRPLSAARPTTAPAVAVPQRAHARRTVQVYIGLRTSPHSPHRLWTSPRTVSAEALGRLPGAPIKWILFGRSGSHESNFTETDVRYRSSLYPFADTTNPANMQVWVSSISTFLFFFFFFF